MDILYIVPYVPNLIRVRPYNFIRYLSEVGNRVQVMTLWTNDGDYKDIENLRDDCYRVKAQKLPRIRSLYNCVRAVPSGIPLQAAYSWQPSLAKSIIKEIETGIDGKKFDVIHIEHLRGAKYGVYLNENSVRENNHIPVIWDSVDSISYLFRQSSNKSRTFLNRWMAKFELKRTEKYEKWLVGQFDNTIVTSESDRKTFLGLNQNDTSNNSISLLPNGVDLNYFSPGDEANREQATLVISGKMSYHANISMVFEFVDNILPLVWAKRPDTKLWIVGKDPPRDILELGRHQNITVTGTVDDIRPFLNRATIAVAPLTYGAGIQNKVLEAMACATPVVASRQATSALKTQNGRDVLIGNDAKHFAELILRLLKDDLLRCQLGQNGRQFVEKYHNWKTVARDLEELYRKVVENNS